MLSPFLPTEGGEDPSKNFDKSQFRDREIYFEDRKVET
jgi:hypothetical protein